MFRLEAHLELLSAGAVRDFRPEITIRGYDSNRAAVTGQFIKDRAVSVGDVVAPCPAHRDVFLRRKRAKKGEKNWARDAGHFIQQFLESVYDSHQRSRAPGGVADSSAGLVRESRRLYDQFAAKKKARLKGMDALVATRFDLNSDVLGQLLVNSAAADLFALQGALNYERIPGAGADRALSALQLSHKYTPADYIKISADSSPDIVLPKFGAIGDMKSGHFKEDYLLTVAGYALGYESANPKQDMDIGVLYLVETGDRTIGASRPYFFWITDDLRRRFLDRRDQLLSVLASDEEPRVLAGADDRAKYCERCAYNAHCPHGSAT